jgi:hypothetical protein
VVAEVGQAFGVREAGLRQRIAQEAFRATVYLPRRVANLPLREVAQWAGVSPGRVSQIQREIEDGRQDDRIGALCVRLGLTADATESPSAKSARR